MLSPLTEPPRLIVPYQPRLVYDCLMVMLVALYYFGGIVLLQRFYIDLTGACCMASSSSCSSTSRGCDVMGFGKGLRDGCALLEEPA